MRFTANRQALSDAFQVVGSIIQSRPMRPILSHIHLVVGSSDEATLMSTDLEIAIRYRVPVTAVQESGEAVIPAARATAILRECVTEEVEISVDDAGKVKLSSGRSQFHLLSESPDEFPEIPAFDEERSFSLDREKLGTLIKKTQFAVAREKSRFAFNGAKLQIEGDEARMVATDGKRLAMMLVGIENEEGTAAGPIVPARALALFEKVMSSGDARVRVAIRDNEIMLKTATAELSSRLVEGSFPNYDAVIPKESTLVVRFRRDVLASAFRQAALLTSHESRAVRFSLDDGRAILSAQAHDAGEARIELDAPGTEGESFQISFNPDYIIDGLKVMEAEEIDLCFSRTNAPMKMLGDEGFVYVVMPVTMRSA